VQRHVCFAERHTAVSLAGWRCNDFSRRHALKRFGEKRRQTMAHENGQSGDVAMQLWQNERVATPDITAAQAQAALAAALRKAELLNTRMDIAVVDAGANLRAFLRMDGAWLGSIDIAIKKARTARFFDMNTGDIGRLSQPGGPLYNIEHSNGGLITFPGGIPLRNGQGEVIGGIGVSGSTVENDQAVADAGARVVSSVARPDYC
jgi:uncharacterized protein GlcG (DUF336 family)